VITRLVCAAVALACALVVAWLAAHHPLSPAVIGAAAVAVAGLTAWRFDRWPLWLMPWLPVASLAPWTGWLLVEEWDVLVLAAAAGGYARLARGPNAVRRGPPPSIAAWLFLLPWLGLALLAMARGAADAGGWSFQDGWWQGYREPLNTLRLAKPTFQVLLLWPLWHALVCRHPDEAAPTLLAAMLGVALMVSLPVWWERLAFTDLLNFSTDYRATGLFWEMHVGGAALDAALALVFPFMLAALAKAKGPRAWALAAGLLGLVFYAALVTFSRIVYLALPVGGALWWWLDRRSAGDRVHSAGGAAAASVAGLAVAAAAWLFPVAGYRGLLALLAVLTVALAAMAELVTLGRRARMAVAASGVLALAVVASVAVLLPKGAYVACALMTAIGLGAALLGRVRGSNTGLVLAGGSVIGLAGAIVAVAWHWGGGPGWDRAWVVALPWVLAVVVWPSHRPPWPSNWRWQGQTLLLATLLVALVGVFGGGDYMSGRLVTASQDVTDRRAHWNQLLDLLRTPEQQLLGQGLGRVPASLAMSGQAAMRTGDYRLVHDGPGSALVLTSGSHEQGWGELFRVSQRLAGVPGAGSRVRLRLRPLTPVNMHAEVCAKHLLYDGGCQAVQQAVKDDLGAWRVVELAFPSNAPDRGRWYAPRQIVFSMAIDALGGRVEIDDLSLTDGQGREWLVNGSFERGLQRWFFSSDRHHMPWHAKNLVVHLWFEQGLLAVGLLAAGLAVALIRTSLGAAARHPLAPSLCAAMVGLLIVGLVDSVFDMPRVTFLTLWLLVLALSLRAPLPSRAGSGSA
jgi:hypothetical protein